MHELANELIQKKNEERIDTYSYENQRKINPNGCVHYLENTRCHDMEELNCFFCLCPKYDRTVKEGACRINSPDSKYIDNHEGKILDCSDCGFPHIKDNAVKLLENLFK
jgi:Zn-finger protein